MGNSSHLGHYYGDVTNTQSLFYRSLPNNKILDQFKFKVFIDEQNKCDCAAFAALLHNTFGEKN